MYVAFNLMRTHITRTLTHFYFIAVFQARARYMQAQVHRQVFCMAYANLPQWAFLHRWRALPETLVHFLMFIDTFKSFSLTFYCFYSVTHHFSTFHWTKEESSITCMGMLRMNQSKLTGPNHAARVNVSRNAFFSSRSERKHILLS